MILQSLHQHYQHLLARGEPGLSLYGYSSEKISYEIVLGLDGAVRDVNDIRDTSGKKPFPRSLNVPQPEKRASGINSNFLWDKTSYVLGVSATSKRADKEHEAFKALHQQHLASTDDPGLHALLAFLSMWNPERFQSAPFHKDMLDTNFVFRLDGEKTYLHERPAAQIARSKVLATDDDETQTSIADCLMTSEKLPVARLHPAIKGVNGAQTSGASIVSFQQDSFRSYGKTQGNNAPISELAAFAYTTVLNHLLRRGEHNRNRLQIADASVVFWAETPNAQAAEAAELDFAALLDPPPEDTQEAARLREMLEQVRQGKPLHQLDPRLQEDTRMAVLGLAPNASRLSIRFWQRDTLEAFARRLGQHAQDLRIEPVPWRTEPSAYRLVLATVPHREGSMPKMDDALNNLAGELMRAILTGGLYPRSLLVTTIMRIRADGNLSGLRAAICKGVLARERRLGINTQEEEVPVSLDKQSINPGYRLGRLFAVLEAVQSSALNSRPPKAETDESVKAPNERNKPSGRQVNTTIRDRYYGAASATPALVFPVLLRNAQNHLSKLRKDKETAGLGVYFEEHILDIMEGLPERFPRSLRIEDQGRFAIGYYHQMRTRFAKGEADASINETNEGDSE